MKKLRGKDPTERRERRGVFRESVEKVVVFIELVSDGKHFSPYIANYFLVPVEVLYIGILLYHSILHSVSC